MSPAVAQSATKRALAALSTYGLDPPQAWLLRAESEAYEREIARLVARKAHYLSRRLRRRLAKWTLEVIKTLGFRACLDEEGAVFLADASGRRRRPPVHAVKELERIACGLRVDPGLIDAIWPPEVESSRTSPLSPLAR